MSACDCVCLDVCLCVATLSARWLHRYAARPLFTDFLKRYEILAWGNPNIQANGAGCRLILDRAKIDGYQIGKTKVFMRYWHVDELNAKLKPILMAAKDLQKFGRGFIARRQYQKLYAVKVEQDKKVRCGIA